MAMMQPPPTLPERRRARKRSQWFSNLLMLAGLGCLIYAGTVIVESRLAQDWASYEFERILAEQPAAPAPVAPAPEPGEWLGRLEIPRLDVSVMVREGDDDSTLRIAAGHLPHTALPGQPGTVAIAGHRDTFFRALQSIRSNDVIRLETRRGTHEYVVDEIKIVEPTQTEVLRSKGQPVLSLITCYPFNYVGAAPQRLVVRARETKETTVDAAVSRTVANGARSKRHAAGR